jgi:hypothetical protein
MSNCARCGASFGCGMADGGDAPCWCTRLPALPREAYRVGDDAGGGNCFCPACLQTLIAASEKPVPPLR